MNTTARYLPASRETELTREKVAKVPQEPLVVLRTGTAVLPGNDVRDMKYVRFARRKDRDITGDTSATIHISKLSSDYVQDVGREFRPGDLIRAKVIQTKPSVQLSTQEPHFGVVKASCRKCRAPLSVHGKALKCEPCERVENRKVADDYGDINF